jgi:hemoglobin-like flavoprotein
MNQKQIDLVMDSWDYILMNTQQAGTIFYDRLFTVDPSLKSLFKEDINTQATKLVNMITFVVKKLNNLGEVVNDVKQLGERHAKYNVKPEHYATVASALLWTLEKGMGSNWTNDHKEAWVAAYTILSTTMQSAAKAA